MKKCTIVGIQKTVQTSGKNEGKTYINYFLTEPFTQYELENSDCLGLKVSKEFSIIDFGVKVSDVVIPYYERMIFNGQERAVLTDLIPAKLENK